MIFAYNKEHVGDTLLVMLNDDRGLEQTVERKVNVAKVTNSEGTIVGWNFFNISTRVAVEGAGQVYLTEAQVAELNQIMKEAGFNDELVYDATPQIVVGHVESCVAHPDSDHLSITQTRVAEDEVLQIVCGAPNIKAGLKVVVAKPGTMMPDGLLIWPGVLRGEESFGMICSAKELRLANASAKRGILELPFDAVVGQAVAVGQ
ncbi:MAG: YtpR family tRNA-binding protein [Enterococcus sp.]